MKNAKKYSLLLLPLLVLTSCKNKEDSGSYPEALKPQQDAQIRKVEGTLHDISYSYENGVPFFNNGRTDYVIYKNASNNYINEAATFLFKELANATGYAVEQVLYTDDQVIPSTEKAIILGSVPSMEAAGIAITNKDIGFTGYQMETKGNACYIYGGNEGYQLAVIKFLELTVGYDWLYKDVKVYEKDGSILPSMNIVERPDFDYRMVLAKDMSFKYAAGYSDNDIFINVESKDPATNKVMGKQQWHTSFKFFDPMVYFEDHPKIYMSNPDGTSPDPYNYDASGNKIFYGNSANSKYSQLCYLAHGDAEERQFMVEETARKILEFQANPLNAKLNNITFTCEDNRVECACEACTAFKASHGNSIAATVVDFLNEVDNIVQAALEEEAQLKNEPVRELNICFFSYHNYEKAPTTIDENGEHHLIDGFCANPHVCAFYAPIHASYLESFYVNDNSYPANIDAANNMLGWSKVCDKIYCWLYETNFQNYMYPYNTFTPIVETYKFLKEHNCSMIFPQGQHNAGNSTAFHKLKVYINSKVLVNLNLNVNDLIKKFFKNYYRNGADEMYNYFLELRDWYDTMKLVYDDIITGYINDPVENKKIWSPQVLLKWRDMCYSALDANRDIEFSDPERFAQLKDACISESIFPRWALLNLFDNVFSPDELMNEYKKFKEDCEELGFDVYKESDGSLSTVFKKWGV